MREMGYSKVNQQRENSQPQDPESNVIKPYTYVHTPRRNPTNKANEIDEFIEMNRSLKIFLTVIHIIFYPIIALPISLFISFATGFVFLLYGLATAILTPFFPFYVICCLCGENGIFIAKIFSFLALSSLIVTLIAPFILIGGVLISLCDFFKNYYFIAIQRISPNNKFKKNYRLLLSLTFGYISRLIGGLSNLKDKLIQKSTPNK